METIMLTPQEFADIRDFLKVNCGIELGEDKDYLVKTRLFEIVKESGESFHQILKRAILNQNNMRQKLIHLLTTHETFWFRDDSLWNTLEKNILPQLFSRVQAGEKINIWSAGCSTGQEPYSMVMLIDEFCKRNGFSSYRDRFQIWATDISQNVLDVAKQAIYNSFDIQRGLSNPRRTLYFQPKGDSWQFLPDFGQSVRFQTLNLIEDFTKKIGPFHLVLCRNVFVYFATDYKDQALEKLTQILEPEGFLFLGASESIEGKKSGLEKKEFEGGKYYQKRRSDQEGFRE